MIYILYGSQTGNAESIARDLGTQCQDTEIGNIIIFYIYYILLCLWLLLLLQSNHYYYHDQSLLLRV